MAEAKLPQAVKGLVKKGSISLLPKKSARSGLVDMKTSAKKQDEPKQYSTIKHHLPPEPQKSTGIIISNNHLRILNVIRPPVITELAESSKLSYERSNDRTKKTSTTNSAVVSCKKITHGPKQSSTRNHPVQTKITKGIYCWHYHAASCGIFVFKPFFSETTQRSLVAYEKKNKGPQNTTSQLSVSSPKKSNEELPS